MIAALMEDSDNGERLLDATRRLCSAFSDLLTAAEPDTKEVNYGSDTKLSIIKWRRPIPYNEKKIKRA